MLFRVHLNLARLRKSWIPMPPEVFAWNTTIRKHAKSDYPFEAVKAFFTMRRMGIPADNYTYPFVLKGCGRCCRVGEGRQVHCLVVKSGFLLDHYVGNTLLSMYGDCGAIRFARMVFDEMPERDVVSWSSLIAACVTCNCFSEAILVFQQMMISEVKLNSVTIVSLLCASTHLGSLRMGESLHLYIIVNDIKLDIALGTALIEMYSRCGHLEKALQVFDSMSEKNLKTWTVMICGLSNHGRGEDALSLFIQMEKAGLKPDSILFTGLLCACSHLGLVKEGQEYFDRMVNAYNIDPKLEHYGCMVDLFGRAGMMKEAYEIVKSMPMEPNSIILRSFLSACKIHGWDHVDDHFKEILLEIEPTLGANYVLAANMSAMSCQWDDMAKLRVAMKGRGLKKVPGCSWVK
ncbi:hypothetical protein Scep_003653 [Stephania cephalantha]|uniref:Pentatricopeptide repeat-containing protein n=1 Tax=Stephania cephalantha TaxID=152367 RepID=A0AAP0KTL6_9MAGN